jgi:hypothetical protein
MADDTLNKYLQPSDSPIADPGGTAPWKFGVTQSIQQNRMRTSQINIKNFVQLSSVAQASGAIGNGTTLVLTTTLSPNVPRQNDINFSEAYIALYQGTVVAGAFQIYPAVGGSVTPGAYTVQGGYDYQAFSTAIPQSNSVWRGIITDNTAGNQTITFLSLWKFLQYNSGTAS